MISSLASLYFQFKLFYYEKLPITYINTERINIKLSYQIDTKTDERSDTVINTVAFFKEMNFKNSLRSTEHVSIYYVGTLTLTNI